MVFMGLVQMASCTKSIDNLPNDSVSLESSNDAAGPFEFSNCKLRRIYQSYGEGNATINGLFTYNKAGNPVSAVFTSPDGDYGSDHYFFYDKQNRLRKYQILVEEGIGIETHFYGYDENNRIVKDTSIWNSGQIEQDFVHTLSYDDQGRVIKENIKNTKYLGITGKPEPLERDRNPTYTYDNRGNIGVLGWKSSSYDRKVSIFRSHPIFQFIHRNYSVNNSSVQAKYNSRGLPLAVVPGNDYFFNLTNVTKAIYDCQ
jgi:hypothetical protein